MMDKHPEESVSLMSAESHDCRYLELRLIHLWTAEVYQALQGGYDPQNLRIREYWVPPRAMTESYLRELFLCPSFGTVTTWKNLIDGFPHTADWHRYIFFEPATGKSCPGSFSEPPDDLQVQCQSTTPTSHSYPAASPHGSLSETSPL